MFYNTISALYACRQWVRSVLGQLAMAGAVCGSGDQLDTPVPVDPSAWRLRARDLSVSP